MREAAVMLIVKDSLILSISRRHDSTKFGLPGGKLETSEQPKDAAIRETFEETGIKVNECKFLYLREEPPDRPGGETFYTHCFLATEWIGEPSSSEEGQVVWLPKEDLISLDKGAFPDYNREVFKAFDLYLKQTN